MVFMLLCCVICRAVMCCSYYCFWRFLANILMNEWFIEIWMVWRYVWYASQLLYNIKIVYFQLLYLYRSHIKFINKQCIYIYNIKFNLLRLHRLFIGMFWVTVLFRIVEISLVNCKWKIKKNPGVVSYSISNQFNCNALQNI